jgi:hypothetical protein
MDYLRQIEDDLNTICQESKKYEYIYLVSVTLLTFLCSRRYPEVKEAAEKALQSLRMIREVYVSDVMRRDTNQKTRAFPTSSDLSAPYILACNYSDGNVKLVGFTDFSILIDYLTNLIPV